MSFRESLDAARTSIGTAIHEFRLKSVRGKDHVHLFFEGSVDSAFYYPIVTRVNHDGKPIHIYSCGNKQGVIDTYSKLLANGYIGEGKLLFFIDKDLDDLVGNVQVLADEFFVTDWYSIENYLVSEEMLQSIWQTRFHLTGVSVDFEIVRSTFAELLADFYRQITPMSAWILQHRRNGTSVNLQSLNLSKIFLLDQDFTLSIVDSADLFANLEQICQVRSSSRIDIGPVLIELSQHNPKVYVRGKFELWLFVKYIDQLVGHLRESIVEGGGQFRAQLNLGLANAVHELSPLVTPPRNLVVFLERHLAS